MLREMLRSMFDDARRGEDRARFGERPAPGGEADGGAAIELEAGKPPILRRRTIRTLCVFALAGIVYGTLVPFRIDATRLLHWGLAWTPFQPGDGLCNVLVYVPVGLLLRLMIRRRGSWAISEWATSLVAAAGLSYLTEVTQTVLAGRVATWTDVVFNTLGAVVGIALAPAAQRMLRNQHAWLYGELRVRPFSAAAAIAWLGLMFAALIPFDFQPTPGRVVGTIAHVRASLTAGPWQDLAEVTVPSGKARSISSVDHAPEGSLPPGRIASKLMAGGAYGVLAMLLAFAAVELGRRGRAAIRYAVGRTIILAAVVEVLQGLTVSHRCDPWDLLDSWAWTLAAGVVTAALLRKWRDRLPRPMEVLRLMVLGGVVAVFVPHALLAHLHHAGAGASSVGSWLPMAASFQRSWMGLMADYASSFLQYSLICALLVVWLRTRRQVPFFPILAAVVLWFPFFGASIAILLAHSYDTMQFVIALLAAAAITGCDRALFAREGRSPLLPR